jgi:hypothetical protein
VQGRESKFRAMWAIERKPPFTEASITLVDLRAPRC